MSVSEDVKRHLSRAQVYSQRGADSSYADNKKVNAMAAQAEAVIVLAILKAEEAGIL